MNLKYKILAVLAAGIALTACGGSGAPASTPASNITGRRQSAVSSNKKTHKKTSFAFRLEGLT